MKKLAVFLAVLILLLPLTAFAEESNIPSVPEETKVEILLRNQMSVTEINAVLLLGGNASGKWQDFNFDMYPYTTAVLTLENTLCADWVSGVSYLSMYAPKAVIFCLDGNDKAEDVAAFINLLSAQLKSVRVYIVSAFSGNNLSSVNQAAADCCQSQSNASFIDVYSLTITEDGTPDPKYIGEGITAAGIRLMGETVSKTVNSHIPVMAPSVSAPVEDTSDVEETDAGKKTSYRWLVPMAILAVGLIIGVDCARTAQENEKRRKARNK